MEAYLSHDQKVGGSKPPDAFSRALGEFSQVRFLSLLTIYICFVVLNMNFCENVTSCTEDACTDLLCFDSATGILTTNPLDDMPLNVTIWICYALLRAFQLYWSARYWQNERVILASSIHQRKWKRIRKQMFYQFVLSITYTIGFYLLVQQSLYVFIALVFVDTFMVYARLEWWQKKDDSHPVQNVLVELWHLYDEAHDQMGHDKITNKLDQLIALMRKQNNNEVPEMPDQLTRRNLSF